MGSGGIGSGGVGQGHSREGSLGPALCARGEVFGHRRADRRWRGALQTVRLHPPVRARETGAERGARGAKTSSRGVLFGRGRRSRTATDRASGGGVVRAPGRSARQLQGGSVVGLRVWGSRAGPQAGGGVGVFLVPGGHSGEGRRWLEEALTQEGPTSALVRAKALGAVSRLASEQGDYVRAKEAAEEGLTRSKEAGTQDSRRPFFVRNNPAPFLLNQLANVSLHKGDYERARELGEESLALGRQADDARSIVLSLIILAIAATLRADYEQAEKLNAEGMSLARELQSAYTRFLCLQNWGWTALLQGDPARATLLIEEAVELARERRRGFMGWLSSPLNNLGWAALLGDELGRARAQFGENLTLSKKLGDKGTMLMSLEGLACVAEAEGETLRAARLFGAAEAQLEEIGYRFVTLEKAVQEPYRSRVRSRLGEAAWEEAHGHGRAMRLDEAIEYALSREKPTSTLSSTPEHPGGLTSREVEVLGLVAEGLTNAQVAKDSSLVPAPSRGTSTPSTVSLG